GVVGSKSISRNRSSVKRFRNKPWLLFACKLSSEMVHLATTLFVLPVDLLDIQVLNHTASRNDHVTDHGRPVLLSDLRDPLGPHQVLSLSVLMLPDNSNHGGRSACALLVNEIIARFEQSDSVSLSVQNLDHLLVLFVRVLDHCCLLRLVGC